jgi:hypothetical protein
VKPRAAPPPDAAALHFRATGRDRCGSLLGVLVDGTGAQQHLVIAADGRSSLARALPSGQAPVLLYESTANVLCGGSPNPDGSISYQGDSYRIEASLDRDGWTARVRPEQAGEPARLADESGGD